MVKHIILWQLKSEFSEAQRERIKSDIKNGLEELYGKIDGLTEISVKTAALSSSNADLMLDCTFTDETALAAYQKNPLHIAVADGKVRPHVQTRLCIDFKV